MIYFIGNRDIKRVKIGFSTNTKRRLKDMQTGSPVKLEIIGQCEGGYGKEQDLHKEFALFRTHGEWFELKQQILDFIVDDNIQENLRYIEERNKQKIGKCQHCEGVFKGWQCEICKEKWFFDICPECHNELVHDLIRAYEKQ